MNASVSQLFRYPVKSMIGESCKTLTIGSTGTLGDRVWAVRDEKRGGIRGGKKNPFADDFDCLVFGSSQLRRFQPGDYYRSRR
ncbi:MAG: MOSC N-terminal beta barrel domain-containing protein [Halioglobus sp.]